MEVHISALNTILSYLVFPFRKCLVTVHSYRLAYFPLENLCSLPDRELNQTLLFQELDSQGKGTQ